MSSEEEEKKKEERRKKFGAITPETEDEKIKARLARFGPLGGTDEVSNDPTKKVKLQ